MVPEIVPAVVCVNVPIATGEEKLPLALDKWAVKTFPGVKVPAIVKGTETPAPEQNGEPDIVPVEIVCIPANKRNLFVPMGFEPVTAYVPAVPAKEVYVPFDVVLPPIVYNGAIAVCRVMETELFVKLPVDTSDQYSVLLIEDKVAS